MSLRSFIHKLFEPPIVRPWALAAPILVLLIALPMLRPLRHPGDISEDEALRLATISSIVKYGTLALEPTDGRFDEHKLFRSQGAVYADQPPMLAVLLSQPAWVMKKMGLASDDSSVLFPYVLTLLGVTIPVAAATGLLYRMGRLFELARPWRAALAAAIVFGSGLVSYSVVLNPHAPAAVFVLCAAACLIHVSLCKLPKRGVGWMLLAGACASFAAALDPPAGLIGALLLLVIPAMRMPIHYRALGMIAVRDRCGWTDRRSHIVEPLDNRRDHSGFERGATALSLASARASSEIAATRASIALDEPDSDDVIASSSQWTSILKYVRWFSAALIGPHGILTHFPVLILGFFGIAAVMHRHWPSFVKSLAAASAIGAVLIIGFYGAVRTDWHEAMFASRWFVIFLPLLLFWSGAWLRRHHSPLKWSMVSVLLLFSVGVSLIGMTEPYPSSGYDRYTAGQALRRIFRPPPTQEILAGTSMVPASAR